MTTENPENRYELEWKRYRAIVLMVAFFEKWYLAGAPKRRRERRTIRGPERQSGCRARNCSAGRGAARSAAAGRGAPVYRTEGGGLPARSQPILASGLHLGRLMRNRSRPIASTSSGSIGVVDERVPAVLEHFGDEVNPIGGGDGEVPGLPNTLAGAQEHLRSAGTRGGRPAAGAEGCAESGSGGLADDQTPEQIVVADGVAPGHKCARHGRSAW